MGTVQWLMILGSRSKIAIFALLFIGLALVGLVGGRAYYLSKQGPAGVAAVITSQAEANLAAATALTPTAPSEPRPVGTGVFDQIAAEVSGV